MTPFNASSLPHLRAYLERESRRRNEFQGELGVAIGLWISYIAIAIVTMIGTGFVQNSPVASLLFLLFSIPAMSVGLGAWLVRRWHRRIRLGGSRADDALATARQLHRSMMARRIHREVPVAVAELLDASASHWKRIQIAFDTPSWRRHDLPDQMRQLKERALAASDDGMEEIILTLRTTFRPSPNPDWREVVGGVLEQLGVSVRGAEPLPLEYAPALRLAEQLRDLADEVTRVAGATNLEGPRAEDRLRDVLSDLRDYQTAHQELDDELRTRR